MGGRDDKFRALRMYTAMLKYQQHKGDDTQVLGFHVIFFRRIGGKYCCMFYYYYSLLKGAFKIVISINNRRQRFSTAYGVNSSFKVATILNAAGKS